MEQNSHGKDQEEAQRLLSQVLEKGVAAVLADYLWAAKTLKLDAWAIEEASREFGTETVKRLLVDTQQNAKLGTMQMSQVTELLVGAGYESTMVHGILATLSQVMHGKKIPHSDSKD